MTDHSAHDQFYAETNVQGHSVACVGQLYVRGTDTNAGRQRGC
jgi:hypothetical protein